MQILYLHTSTHTYPPRCFGGCPFIFLTGVPQKITHVFRASIAC